MKNLIKEAYKISKTWEKDFDSGDLDESGQGGLWDISGEIADNIIQDIINVFDKNYDLNYQVLRRAKEYRTDIQDVLYEIFTLLTISNNKKTNSHENQKTNRKK